MFKTSVWVVPVSKVSKELDKLIDMYQECSDNLNDLNDEISKNSKSKYLNFIFSLKDLKDELLKEEN